MGEDDELKTLVGIVDDVRAVLHNEPPPTAYYPYWQRVPDEVSLVVRTIGDPQAAAGAVRAALRGEDAQLPVQAMRTMEEVVDRSVAQRRFQLTLMGVFAASALLVASLGIYGVVAYSVARRRNEIGIRMALGAQRSQLLGLMIRQGMTPVAVGLAAGVAAALVLGRAIRGLLFGIQPADPLTISAVIVVLLLVGALACIIPARRAAGRRCGGGAAVRIGTRHGYQAACIQATRTAFRARDAGSHETVDRDSIGESTGEPLRRMRPDAARRIGQTRLR